LLSPHVSRFGGDSSIQDAARGMGSSTYYPTAVAAIHASGGAASWNHPFGSGQPAIASADQLVQRRRQVFTDMMAVGAYGVDALEVAYFSRGGANMRAHLDLWDTFLRNLVLLTGTGANDDHAGGSWGRLKNGFHTVTLSSDATQESLVQAIGAGRASFGHTGLAPQSVLDLELDDGAVMGQVSTSAAIERTLTVFAAGLPTGSGVRIVQGMVDRAGTSQPDPLVQTLGSVLPASRFSTGSVQVPFSASGAGTYLRVEVIGADGTSVVAGSNPVFALPSGVPTGVSIPSARLHGVG